MNLQILTKVNGNDEYLELFGTETLNLDVSFAEIQDITKKNSSYSKEFNLPGSNQNNYIFNYFFDFNQVPLDWVPTRKFEAWLLYNGYVILSGYIRLNSVLIDKEVKTYSVTFYNGVGDVAANIGDKFMRELDLSHLSHPVSEDVWLQSQVDYNLFPLTGTTNYSYQNGKTFWGLYNIGYNYTQSTSGLTSYFNGSSSTSVTISSGSKTITTSPALPFIVGDTIRMTHNSQNWIQGVVTSVNGTTIVFNPNTGLGTGTYSSWSIEYIIPEGLQINDYNTTPQIEFQNDNVPNFFSFSGTPIRSYYFKPAIQIKELYTQIFEQAGYKIESDFFNTSYFERYYLPLKFNAEGVYPDGYITPCYSWSFSSNTPSSGVTCNNVPFVATDNYITIPAGYTGVYTIDCFVTIETLFNVCGPSPGTYDLYLSANSTTYLAGQILDCDPEFSGTFTVQIGGRVNVLLTGPTTLSLYPQVGGATILEYGFSIQSGPSFPPSGVYNYSDEFPINDFKQIDLITSVNKLFNLVVVPSTDKQKTLVVEPIIDYIGKGDILDWTEKIDWDSPMTIVPTTNILNGTVNYNFRLDKDYANQQFNISTNRIFGTYELQLNQDYKDNKVNIDTIFGSPVDIALNNVNLPNITLANLATIKTNETRDGGVFQKFEPYKILPRVVFRGLTYPNQNWGISTATTQTWWAETYEQDRWQEINRFTTYPFSYTGFSHYINFNAQDYFDENESLFPNQQDMYDIYYYDYISDITSPDNKLISAKIYLTPWEISNLKFNEKIFVKNNYYRINKISGYNLVEPALCNIELIKLTKSYTPHPVKYFKLVNCGAGDDLFTTSDLNYNMFAYVGRYVNVYTGSTTAYTSTGCYEVTEIEPDYNADYNPVFIASGYTSSGVNVFNDCGCSGATSFNIIQQDYS